MRPRDAVLDEGQPLEDALSLLLGAAAGCAEQDEPVHPLGGVDGEPLGHHAAERVARHVAAREAEVIEQGVLGEQLDRVRPRRLRRLAVAPPG